MIPAMLLTVAAGFLAGQAGWLQELAPYSNPIIMGCLYTMSFIAGVDMGKQGFFKELKKAGWRVILFCAGTLAGTLLAVLACSPLLPLTAKDALIVASGMGWYSLATGLVMVYSPVLSVAVFVSCLSRELLAMFLMPLLWKKFQVPELVSLSGCASMSPSVAAATVTGDQTFVFYGMISGSLVSALVPVMVPLFIAL